MASDLLIAWAAGLFEGEGTIVAGGKRERRVGLALVMTDEDVVRRFGGVVGFGHVTGPYDRGHKPTWHWHCRSARDVEAVLGQLLPYLGARRTAKALEALAIASTIGPRWQDRTHCKRNHLLAGDNLRVTVKNGRTKRHCRACERARYEAFCERARGAEHGL